MEAFLGFLAGLILQGGGFCAHPGIDISPPAPAPGLEVAIPVEFGFGSISCPPGG